MEKIRICFLHYELVCGGAEQALFDLVSLMDKTKFDITVIVQCDGGIWEDKFRKAGINVKSIWGCQRNSHNPIVKLQNLRKRKAILRCLADDGRGVLDVCDDRPFDIIVSYSIWEKQHMGFTDKAKTVKFIHGDIHTNANYYNNIIHSLKFINQFDRIICVSETARHSFEIETGIYKTTCTHFNPLNSENVKYLSQEGIPLSSKLPIVCAVGRLSPEKGFDRLIHIHKRLLDSGLSHHLVIVGDGPEQEHLENTIAELQVENSVTLVGYTANPYMYMKQCDFLVCSSYTEGLPVVAMEALCLGIPVVSAVPSIGELFGNENCGIVTENDDDSLEAGIRSMLADHEFYAQKKAGAEKRSAFFDGKRMVKEVEEEFISLVNQEN